MEETESHGIQILLLQIALNLVELNVVLATSCLYSFNGNIA